MIQTIAKNADIKFCVSDDEKIQDKFIIKFYTIDKSKVIIRTADDVIVEDGKRYIKLNWSALKYLENGILNYEVNNLDSDADYDDGVYNSTFTRTTYYYLCTDLDLIDTLQQIDQKVDKITTDITDEKTARENGDAQLAEKLKNTSDSLNSNVTNLEVKVDNLKETLNQDVSGLQDSMTKVETNVTKLSETVSNYDLRIAGVEHNYWYIDNDVSRLKKDVKDLQDRLTTAETNVKQNQDNITQLQSRWGSMSGDVDMLKEDVANLKNIVPQNLQDRMDRINSNISSLQDRMEPINSNITNLQTDVADLTGTIPNLQDRLTALEDKFNSHFPE